MQLKTINATKNNLKKPGAELCQTQVMLCLAKVGVVFHLLIMLRSSSLYLKDEVFLHLPSTKQWSDPGNLVIIILFPMQTHYNCYLQVYKAVHANHFGVLGSSLVGLLLHLLVG